MSSCRRSKSSVCALAEAAPRRTISSARRVRLFGRSEPEIATTRRVGARSYARRFSAVSGDGAGVPARSCAVAPSRQLTDQLGKRRGEDRTRDDAVRSRLAGGREGFRVRMPTESEDGNLPRLRAADGLERIPPRLSQIDDEEARPCVQAGRKVLRRGRDGRVHAERLESLPRTRAEHQIADGDDDREAPRRFDARRPAGLLFRSPRHDAIIIEEPRRPKRRRKVWPVLPRRRTLFHPDEPFPSQERLMPRIHVRPAVLTLALAAALVSSWCLAGIPGTEVGSA